MKKFLNLGKQPLANKYLSKKELSKKKEQFYRLQIGFDIKSKLVSIVNIVSSKKMFDNKYPYRSSMSSTMRESFKELSIFIKKKFKPDLILEIGSNDGSLIKYFKKNKALCIEPCKNLAKITTKKGYKTYSEYWNMSVAKKIKSKYEKIDLIYSANTLSHIPNLDSVFNSISYVLSKNGVLIIEDPSLMECLKKTAYDQFYNEHIYVFSLISIMNLMKKHNLEVFDVKKLKTHGGSMRYFIKRKSNKNLRINKNVKKYLNEELNFKIDKFETYIKFRKRVEASKKKLINIFHSLKKRNKKIIGYGSTAKSVTVLNYCKINNKIIDYFVDTTPDKTNKYMPGTHIYIKKYNRNLLNNIDYIFLGAWNFKKEIFKKEKKFIKKGGRFISHIPKPNII